MTECFNVESVTRSYSRPALVMELVVVANVFNYLQFFSVALSFVVFGGSAFEAGALLRSLISLLVSNTASIHSNRQRSFSHSKIWKFATKHTNCIPWACTI